MNRNVNDSFGDDDDVDDDGGRYDGNLTIIMHLEYDKKYKSESEIK